MSLELASVLVGLALLDSLNPATISEAAVLSSSRRPAPAVLAYWAGALTCYLTLGGLLVLGPGALLAGALAAPPDWLRAVGAVVGATMFTAGVVLWRRGVRLGFGTRLADGDPRLAFKIGVVATLGDIPTAAPYYGAVAVLAGSGLSQAAQLGALGAYNLIYLAPVLIVLALRLAAGSRADPLLDAVRGTVERLAGPLLICVLVLGGAGLVADAVWAALAG